MITDKPKEDRVKESVQILRDIQQLGIPLDSPEVIELKQYLDSYIKDGICWSGSIMFLKYGRIADVTLPKRSDRAIEIVLRYVKTRKH